MEAAQRRIKVLVAKMGFDCHDTGAATIAHLLRDLGMEVLYLGLHNSAEKIVAAALQEDVDVIGLSFLSGQHMHYTQELLVEMRRQHCQDVLLVIGGIIPKADVQVLKEMGVDEFFGPGTSVKTIAAYITNAVVQRRPELAVSPLA
jgi:methylmalonyl-CoA mutase C-terminal domain/subunit